MANLVLFLASTLAVATAQQVMLRHLGPYPGYTGDLTPAGHVDLVFARGDVHINYFLKGVDAACTTPKKGTPNSCGIHIHAGKTCGDASKVGGHYYNNKTVASDPWVTAATYKTRVGIAFGSLTVTYGEDYASTMGRAFVLHDREGVRVSCTSIFPNAQVYTKAYTPYPGYSGDVKPLGYVEMSVAGGSVQLAYALIGVDPDCTSPKAGTANSCGIHIHAGTTCDDATKVGGHYYNKTTIPSDPWVTAATYKARSCGGADGTLIVAYGEELETTIGRAFVLHDRQGVRVSCDIIKKF